MIASAMPELLRTLSWPTLSLAVAAALIALTINGSLTGFAMERALAKRKIFDVPLFEGQYRFELIGNAVFIAVMTAAITVALRTGALRLTERSAVGGAATFFAMLLGFQVYYWFLHRAMHTEALLPMHRWHHRSQVTTPLTGQSVSVLEALGWAVGLVAIPSAISQAIALSFWGWAGYLIFNVTGNVVGHSNIEPTLPIAARRGPTWLVNTFLYHALHHARWNGHYSFQAALMDRLLGTEWSDWPALYAKIDGGTPLRSLNERGEVSKSS